MKLKQDIGYDQNSDDSFQCYLIDIDSGDTVVTVHGDSIAQVDERCDFIIMATINEYENRGDY